MAIQLNSVKYLLHVRRMTSLVRDDNFKTIIKTIIDYRDSNSCQRCEQREGGIVAPLISRRFVILDNIQRQVSNVNKYIFSTWSLFVTPCDLAAPV